MMVARGVPPGHEAELQIDGHARRRALVADGVEAGAAEQLVGAGAALEHVVAVEADQDVVAAETEDLVGEVGAVELGVAGVGAGDGGHGPDSLSRAPA